MNSKQRYYFLLIKIYLSFIALGLPAMILGGAWPVIRLDFNQPIENLSLISSTLPIIMALSCFLNDKFCRKFGIPQLCFYSMIFMALSILGIYFSPTFVFLIFFSIILGFSSGFVDASLNLYVVDNYSAREMSWLHCFWGGGAAIGPLIMRPFLYQNVWKNCYGIIFLIEISWTLIFFIMIKKGLWKNQNYGKTRNLSNQNVDNREGLKDLSSQIIAMLSIAFYKGIDLSIGFWLSSVLVESRQLSPLFASDMVAIFYGSIMSGRFLTGFIVNKLGNNNMLRISFIVIFTGIISLACTTNPTLIVIEIICLGLGCGPIFPGIIYETPHRFTKEITARMIGYQMGASFIGGSVLSLLVGTIISKIALELLFLCMIIFFILMVFSNEYLNYKRRNLKPQQAD